MKSLTRMVVAASVAVVSAGAMGTGCISSETTEPTGLLYPTELTFCEKLAELVCNDGVVRGCYGSDDGSLVQDKESCVAAYRGSDTCRPNIEYNADDAAVGACLTAWQGVYSDAAISADEIANAQETCLAVFHDAGVEGEECIADYQCNIASGLRCVIKPGATSGTCQQPVEVDAGHPCGAIEEQCEEGFFCDAAASACLARKNVGEACSSEILCVEDANCSGPVDGTCVAKLANNSECTDDLQCQNGLCNKGTGDVDGLCAGSITLNQTAAVCDEFR